MLVRVNRLVLISAALLFAGCDGTTEFSKEDLEQMSGGMKEVVPIRGKVTINGTPGENVTVFAYTQASGMKPAAQTTTAPDGSFVFSTYQPEDGLAPDVYRLAFAQITDEGKGKKEGTDALQGKFRNPMEHEFVLEVKSGEPQTDVTYNLE